jgi:cytochrome c-type biogenesis protein CcmF
LLGTLYPLFLDVLDMSKVSVGPPFFNAVFVPLMAATVLVMAIGPLLAWKRGNLKSALDRLKPAMIAAAIVVIATWVMSKSIGASLALGLATWLFCGVMGELIDRLCPQKMSLPDFFKRAIAIPRSFYGMMLAHAGVAIVIVGIAGSTAWKTEKIQVMHFGETVDVAGFALTLVSVEENVKGPNYTASRATFLATKNGHTVARLTPERRMYQTPPRQTTNAAIHTNLLGDIYAVIGDPDEKGGYVTRLYYNPLVPWIFIGAGIIALGGVVSLTDRRYRIGVPLTKVQG